MWTPRAGGAPICTRLRPMFRSLCRREQKSKICRSRLKDQESARNDHSPHLINCTMQKLILVNFQSPGDLVTLTAAVRDLHTCYPNQFITDVRTGSPELWEQNPYVTPLDVNDPEVRVLECHYPLIQFSNHRPVHFLQGFIENLNVSLG